MRNSVNSERDQRGKKELEREKHWKNRLNIQRKIAAQTRPFNGTERYRMAFRRESSDPVKSPMPDDSNSLWKLEQQNL